MGESTQSAHVTSVKRLHTLDATPNFMITDLDTGVASTLHNTSWIDKGFDPIDLVVPLPPDVRRGRSKPPLHPMNDPRTKNAPVKETKITGSILRRKSSKRTKHLHRTNDEVACSSCVAVKVDVHKKKEKNFGCLVRIQQVKAHDGAVRALAFSQDGRYLASAGQDAVVNVYAIEGLVSEKPKKLMDTASSSSTPSTDSRDSYDSPNASQGISSVSTTEEKDSHREYLSGSTPLRRYHGHTQDVVDLNWSKNGFLLSASMDMTVMLWHPESSLCLRRFVHSSFVTSVAFHPSDENIFISGSLDGSVRLWHVTEQKLLSVTQTGQFITASAINKDGNTALIGTYHGHCKFYSLYDEIANEWSLKYTTQLDVRSRRAKNNTGKKIAGFTFLPKGDKFIVSSNDSRLRIYRMDDKAAVAKFSGHENECSQLKGSVSPCGKYLLCGSQDASIVIWDMNSSVCPTLANFNDANGEEKNRHTGHGHKERNASYERFVPFKHDQVTAAVFAPRLATQDIGPVADDVSQKQNNHVRSDCADGVVIVAASQNGYLRVFQNFVR